MGDWTFREKRLKQTKHRACGLHPGRSLAMTPYFLALTLHMRLDTMEDRPREILILRGGQCRTSGQGSCNLTIP